MFGKLKNLTRKPIRESKPEMVDEIWVPNQWNHDAFARRFSEMLKKLKQT